MRVRVDFDECDSNGLCVQSAPEVFRLDEEDLLQVLDETPSEAQRAVVEDAVRACPKQAIELLEDDSPA